MLQRPELGTRPAIKLWLAGKDPDIQIDWMNAEECAAATYAAECLGDRDARTSTEDLRKLDEITRDLATDNLTRPCRLVSYGELHAAVAGWN